MSAREQIDEAARRRIESPCIGICVIDPATDRCAGCLRTLAEIAAWSTASAVQRRLILDRVEGRRANQSQRQP